MKFIYSLLLTCLLFSCQTQTTPTETEQDPLVKRIDSLVEWQMESFGAPGVAVGIIKDGAIIYQNAYGVQSKETKAPMTTQSVFHMASVSKPFVATAIVQLVEKGSIDLNEKLTTYLPYFKMKDERYQEITIRQMLNHSSGIHDVEDYEWENPQLDEGAAERYVRSFTEDQLDFAPSTEFNYSNAAFDILADVIAKASGMSFEDYMKKNIFEPAGMKNSTFYKPEVPAAIATSPHVHGPDLQLKVWEHYPYNRIHAPSSTLHSNVEDMMRWALLNLNQGTLDGKQVYSKDSYKMLTSGQIDLDGDSVCLSWFKGSFLDKTILAHSGGDEGYGTYFAFLPEDQTAIVLMNNSNMYWTDDASKYLLKAMLYPEDLKPWKGPIHVVLKDYVLTEGIEKVKAVYQEAKEQSADKYLVGAWNFDDLGYLCIDQGHPQAALELFEYLVELEPEESGWPDSVADAYRALGDKEKAKEWYEKALAMNPDQGFSRRKLDQLLAEE